MSQTFKISTMKRYLFTLEGFVDLPEELTLEQVETALSFLTGISKCQRQDLPNLPNIAVLHYISKNTSYYGVNVNDDKGNVIKYEPDGVKASKLANKLLIAVSECGDYPVCNSTVMPVSSGKPVNMIVYHKGDNHFEFE